MKNRNKVIVVGLDGATFSLLNPLMDEGRMPNLKHIVENGASGILNSTIPPYTATAWTSFATGKNPGKHGVYDFSVKIEGREERTFVDSKLIPGEKTWNTIGRYGKRVGIINFPISYPPEEVNGFMIAGFMSPKNADNYSYPPELFRTMVNNIGDYVIDVRFPEDNDLSENNISNFVKLNLHAAGQRYKAFKYLTGEYDYDFLFILFMSLDKLQHAYWKYMTQTGENYKKGSVQEGILRCYEQIDNILGDILKNISRDTNLIIVSDHGFCSKDKIFRVNQWLINNGFLRYDFKKLLLSKIAERVKTNIGLKKAEKLFGGGGITQSHSLINWNRTQAYFTRPSEQGIHINLKNRGSMGGTAARYNDLREEIKRGLLAYQDNDNAKSVLKNICYPEEIYSGPFLSNAPNLILVPEDGYCPAGHVSLFNNTALQRDTSSRGIHHPDGVFLGFGDNFKKGKKITEASIIDIAPTILSLMNIPVPRDIDGKVLCEALSTEFLKSNPVEYVDPVAPARKSLNEKEYSKQDADEIKDRLKGLGYLD